MGLGSPSELSLSPSTLLRALFRENDQNHTEMKQPRQDERENIWQSPGSCFASASCPLATSHHDPASACLTCNCSSCFSEATAFISQLFLCCSSCCSTSDFSDSSFPSLLHSCRSLASSAFCLEQKEQGYCSPQDSRVSWALRTGGHGPPRA